MRDEIDLYEYWQTLAVAYDAEELDDYNTASLIAIGVNDPKRLKKWKFATQDKAGTKPQNNDASQALLGLALMTSGGDMKPSGDMTSFAQHTGRRIIYMVAQNEYVDGAGTPTVKTRDDLVMPLPTTDIQH